MEYRKGDKIKCIHTTDDCGTPNADLTLGKIYTITRVELYNNVSWQYWFVMDDGEERFFNHMHFNYFINITKSRKEKLIKLENYE